MKNFDADLSVFAPEARILAAVSSGADSMALLLWLHTWLHTLGRDFSVGHVNHDLHELRNGDCERDEAFVRDKCAAIGVRFQARTVTLPRRDGHVNELVAREARYDALYRIARENGCDCVATAHTATDGLETALLNLMRGGAPGGWLGIAPRRALCALNSPGDSIDLVRPFWRTPRHATRQILRENGWNWREDESNRDAKFNRNRVRHQVLPLLAAISGRDNDQTAVLHAKNAQIGRDETVFLDKLASQALETLILKRETDLIALDGLIFQRLDVALQRRVLRLGARHILPDLRGLEATKIEVARLCIVQNQKRAVWTWRKALQVEWTGVGAGNRVRFWRV